LHFAQENPFFSPAAQFALSPEQQKPLSEKTRFPFASFLGLVFSPKKLFTSPKTVVHKTSQHDAVRN